MRYAAKRNQSRAERRVRASSTSRAIIDVDRVDAEMRGEEPIVIDWRNARVRDQGYSAKILGYPEPLYSNRVKQHVRTKDISALSSNPYGRGMAHRLIAPRVEDVIVRAYLAYGTKTAAEMLGVSPATVSAVAHRCGVQRTRRAAQRFKRMGVSEIRLPSPDRLRAWNAAFLRERRAYRKARSGVDLRPDGFEDVPGWEGHYAISRDARVWSYPPPGKRRGRFIKPGRKVNDNGYRRRKTITLFVILGKMVEGTYQTKNVTLAQLVARTFIPNPDGHRSIRFMDDDSTNCAADNLVWVSRRELATAAGAKRRARRSWMRGVTGTVPGAKPPAADFIDIPGWEGLYALSPAGQIWTYPRVRANGGMSPGRLKRPTIQGTEARLVLNRDGRQKSFTLARLVATMFLPNPENKPFVHNKSGVIADCSVGNLEWITSSERAILTNIAIRIRRAGGEVARHPDWLNWRDKPVRLTRRIHAERAHLRVLGQRGKTTPLPGAAPDGFVDIKGWEGRYAVSKTGAVWRYPCVTASLSVTEGRLVKRAKGPFIPLAKDGRYHEVKAGLLVANAFLRKPAGRVTLRYKDGDTWNCQVENLEWVRVSGKTTALRDAFAPPGLVDVPGWHGLYAVSRLGRVWKYQCMSPDGRVNPGGYLVVPESSVVAFRRNNRSYYQQVHHLVAEAFLPNPKGKAIVRFKNGVKGDCRAENLEWATWDDVGASTGATKIRENDILRARGIKKQRRERSGVERFRGDEPRPKEEGPHPWRRADHAGYLKHLALKARTLQTA